MKRKLEPELMDDILQVMAYSKADFSESNNAFVDWVKKDCQLTNPRILDLGCGPADVDIEFVRQVPGSSILAVDGSMVMVELALDRIKKSKLERNITVVRGKLPDLKIDAGGFDIILCKDLLHHLPGPEVFWYEVKRLARRDTLIYMMDLIRPESHLAAKELVEKIAGKEPEMLRKDYYNSLLASFSIEEVEQQMIDFDMDYEFLVTSGKQFLVRCKMK
jgi:ubiquinone/menaquinone biosynthesis C-methylase UbiE